MARASMLVSQVRKEYGGVSFVYNADRCTGEAPRKESYPSMAPGRDPPQKFPKEFPASGREFLGPKFARPPAGRKNAPAFGRGRLVVSEYAGKNDFCKEKRRFFFEKLRFWCPGPPKSTSGPSFSESPRQTIWGPEVLVQIRALRTPFVANQRSHPRRGNLLSVVRPC